MNVAAMGRPTYSHDPTLAQQKPNIASHIGQPYPRYTDSMTVLLTIVAATMLAAQGHSPAGRGLAFISAPQNNNLGEARRSFGNSRNPRPQYHHNYSLEDTTWIVFPEGRADRRYMFPTIGDYGSGIFILCQSKVGKKVRDDWCVELARGKFRRHFGSGTLESKLASNGYYLLKQAPPALAALRARKGFAAYKGNVINGFGYWFIPPDGMPDDYVEGYVKYVELKSSTKLLPWTPFPYPISDMELKRIRQRQHDKLSNRAE